MHILLFDLNVIIIFTKKYSIASENLTFVLLVIKTFVLIAIHQKILTEEQSISINVYNVTNYT